MVLPWYMATVTPLLRSDGICQTLLLATRCRLIVLPRRAGRQPTGQGLTPRTSPWFPQVSRREYAVLGQGAG
jgi:hypothetical protein